MHIHVADDETPKLDSILALVERVLPTARITTSRSVRSALKALRGEVPDLLLLDMSLPTFDVGQGEQGGRPQGFGGIEVLRYMDFYNVLCPVVIITQYEAFPENGRHVDLSSLSQRLRAEHPGSFRDIIYYGGSSHEVWQERLTILLPEIAGLRS